MSKNLFKNIINILVTYQQWNHIMDVLNYANPESIRSERRTFTYIKENMIYCIDQSVRSRIKEKVDDLESGNY